MGKKVITTTTAAFDGQSKPNHITMIGAMPMIGSAETKSAIGRMPRRRNGLRSQINATATPAAPPMAQPGSADFRTVWTKSGIRIACDVASLARIAEGGGNSTKG